MKKIQEGSLEAPIRHPIEWEGDDFDNPKLLFDELKRVFDICSGCRRCFNLCDAFPKLFDLVDETPTGDVNSVDEEKFWEVIDNSIDEHVMGYGVTIDIKITNNTVSIRDYGRGIPLGKVDDCVSKINTGGKYDSHLLVPVVPL